MKTVADIVDEKIKESPFVEEAIADGLINISSYARMLKPIVEKELGKKINIGAVVMAVKRRPVLSKSKISKQIRSFVQQLGNITVRSGITDFTFENSPTLLYNQSKLYKLFYNQQDSFYTFSRGIYETTILANSLLEKKIMGYLKKEKLVSITKNLTAITLSLPSENTKISGVYYYIFQKIAWEGINIVELVSTTNEFTILVENANTEKAFSVIKKISGKNC